MTAVIEARNLSRWYGNVLGISEINLQIEPGITALLGPNGAGKSTFMKIVTGQLKPNLGQVRIYGQSVWNNRHLFRRLGFCPEGDAFYEELNGLEFLVGLLSLYGYDKQEGQARAERALELVELKEVSRRPIRSYSRGMRQRIKIAQAIAHDPEILILDEPLSGLDPLGKRRIIKLVKEFREAGKTIVVSSHVLPEVEAMTSEIILIHHGKILARGDIHFIRELLDSHPHMIRIKSPQFRELAARLAAEDYVLNISFEPEVRAVTLETHHRDRFFNRLNELVLEEGLDLEEITSPDDNLQAVFDYLVER
ncbi:MAG: ABC transporter ATP-binding protein [Candidatus Aminicenantes bacterium]|nr:ABC transporter ATP-binding protein [Candidatus Aminicenantes bacterium]